MLKNEAGAAPKHAGGLSDFKLLRSYGSGVVFSEAFSLAEGRRMISNRDAHQMLRTKSEPEPAGFYTGTLIAFEGRGRQLGEYVRFDNSEGNVGIMKVPQEYRGAIGVALVAEHQSYTMSVVDGICVFNCRRPTAIPIPQEDGWYTVDPVRCLPFGEREAGPVEDLYMFLRANSPYVGPIVRGGDFFGRKVIGACIDYSFWRGSVLAGELVAKEEDILVA